MRKIILSLFILQIAFQGYATEGLWLPLLLSENEAEMQAMGMELTAEDIYSINKGSLKDAIVSFGGFCTGELISGQGLVLTNHHCGYKYIQRHSTVEKDYLKDGFWAMNNAEEIKNEGLYVEFLKYMEEVTNAVLKGVTDNMSEDEQRELINANMRAIVLERRSETDLLIDIKPLFSGNRYFLFASERYTDVRLVGAPPSSIGKYGADTDNWMWPRHTGDFSLFRIYADRGNNPAKPAANNIPYMPVKSLAISLKPKEEGDFSMVFGYPGSTSEYLPAVAVDQIVNKQNALKIRIREAKLKVLDQRMRESDEMRIKYAAKYASTSNSWKKWIGQNIGIRETRAIDVIQKREAEFMYKLAQNESLWNEYKDVLPELNYLYRELEEVALARDYFVEVGYYGIELMRFARSFEPLVNASIANDSDGVKRAGLYLSNTLDGFYKDFEAEADEEIMAALMSIYMEQDSYYVSQHFNMNKRLEKGDYDGYASMVYTKSILTQDTSLTYLKRALKENPYLIAKKLQEDPGYGTMLDFFIPYLEWIGPAYGELNEKIETLQGQYLQAQIEVFDDEQFYPDGNSTLRLSYGLVEGYEPRDGVEYGYQTYLSGAIAKYQPGDYEFDLPEKLLELFETKDYGRYGEGDKMPVCFIGSNHTTSGNSGSPVLNGRGELIGLNFDRVWEGTMSDLYFDRSRCRNVMVDMRYVLFIIDKFAGASYLIDEMDIVD